MKSINYNNSFRCDTPAGMVRYISTKAELCNNPKFDANLSEKKRYKIILELDAVGQLFIDALENMYKQLVAENPDLDTIQAPKFWKKHGGVIQIVAYSDYPIAGGRDLKGYTGAKRNGTSNVIVSGYLRFVKTDDNKIGMTYTVSHASVTSTAGFFGDYTSKEDNASKAIATRESQASEPVVPKKPVEKPSLVQKPLMLTEAKKAAFQAFDEAVEEEMALLDDEDAGWGSTIDRRGDRF